MSNWATNPTNQSIFTKLSNDFQLISNSGGNSAQLYMACSTLNSDVASDQKLSPIPIPNLEKQLSTIYYNLIQSSNDCMQGITHNEGYELIKGGNLLTTSAKEINLLTNDIINYKLSNKP